MRNSDTAEDVCDKEIIEGPLTADDLAEIRRARNDPNYAPPPSVNPLHDNWTDTQVILLGPFLGRTIPPTLEEINRIMQNHSALEARPGHTYHETGLETLAHYCFRHENIDWKSLGMQLSRRGNFRRLLEMHDPQF